MSTISTKPYLLRAIWEWCVDQGFTPYLAAIVDGQTRVPPGYARDGQIVLNLSSDATGQLQMANDYITFQARFGGVAHSLVIPVANVIAIYARENGQGMAFEPELEEAEEHAPALVSQDGGAGEPATTEEMGEAAAKAREEAAKSGDGLPRRPRPSHLTVVK
ncbi:ClpXP protease specificity-enhancing factor [Thauera sp.]|uniref:ClpXP protease specificity-enhancing factor n=1 Tax=Thauera sp. TaxID=1905334 RepID=UPI0039E631CF